MFGKSWIQQHTSGLKTAPLPGESKYELILLSTTPLSKLEKDKHEATLGWKYRSILEI